MRAQSLLQIQKRQKYNNKMPSISNQLVKRTNQLHRRVVQGNRIPCMQQLHTLVACIEILSHQQQYQQQHNQLSTIQDRVLDVLKCMSDWGCCKGCAWAAEQCVQLYYVIVANINALKYGKHNKQLTTRLQKLPMTILTPHIPTLKPKQLLSLLSPPTPLPISILLLQQIPPSPKHAHLIHQYASGLLSAQKTVTQIQAILKQMFSILCDDVDMEYYMGVWMVRVMLADYVVGFEEGYARQGKYIGGRYQVRVIGGVLQKIIGMKYGTSFNQVIEDKDKNPQQTVNCNICNNCANRCTKYVLTVSQNYYTISICNQCIQLYKPSTKSKQSGQSACLPFLLHLYANCQPLQQCFNLSHFLQRLAPILPVSMTKMKPQFFTYCQQNKELKHIRSSLLSYLYNSLLTNNGQLQLKLWTMLMIISNHEDPSTRIKCIKCINGILSAYPQYLSDLGESTVTKLYRMFVNRCGDINQEVRFMAGLGLLSTIVYVGFDEESKLKEISFVLGVVNKECVQEGLTNRKGTGNAFKITEKCIGDVISKLIQLMGSQLLQSLTEHKIPLLTTTFACICTLSSTSNLPSHPNKKPPKKQTPPLNSHKPQLKHIFNELHQSEQILKFLKQLLTYEYKQYAKQIRQCSYNMMIDYVCVDMGYEKEIRDGLMEIVERGDGLWVGNQRLVAFVVDGKSSTVQTLIHSIFSICNQSPNLQLSAPLIQKCKLLQSLLPSCPANNPSLTPHLHSLRTLLLTQLVPQANTIKLSHTVAYNNNNNIQYTSQQDINLYILCSLLLGVEGYLQEGYVCTFGMYQRLGVLVGDTVGVLGKQGDREGKQGDRDGTKWQDTLRLGVLTVKMMLAIIPHIYKAIIKSTNDQHQIKFNPNFPTIHTTLTELFNIQLANQYYTTQPSILLQSTHQLCTLLHHSPNLLPSTTPLLNTLLSVPLSPTPIHILHLNNILLTLATLLRQSQSTLYLDKIRDMFMFVLYDIQGGGDRYERLLDCRGFYHVLVGLYRKGMVSVVGGFGKYVMFGAVCNGDYQGFDKMEKQCIKDICVSAITDVVADINEARQLFSTMGQVIKVCISHYGYKQNHCLYFPLTQLSPQPQPIPKKTSTNIHPSLLNCLLDLVSTQAINTRLLSSNAQPWLCLTLLQNTIDRCTSMTVSNLKIILPCLMAIIDCIYFQVLAECKKQSKNGVGLWIVCMMLAKLLRGNPYQFMLKELYKLGNKTQFVPCTAIGIQYNGVQSIQKIYDIIIQGRQYKDYQPDEQSTYDTENKIYSNTLHTKGKKQQDGKRSQIVKNTKKGSDIQRKRNKTAPKSHIDVDDFRIKQKDGVKDAQVEEYRTKLRVRKNGYN